MTYSYPEKWASADCEKAVDKALMQIYKEDNLPWPKLLRKLRNETLKTAANGGRATRQGIYTAIHVAEDMNGHYTVQQYGVLQEMKQAIPLCEWWVRMLT